MVVLLEVKIPVLAVLLSSLKSAMQGKGLLTIRGLPNSPN